MKELNTILKSIDKEKSINLLRQLIQQKTVNPPGNEKIIADILADELKTSGINTEIKNLENNRANVIGRIKGTGEKKALMFNGHMDTVPPGDIEWKYDPYAAYIDRQKIYGRGAVDMKSGLAAMLLATKAIKNSGLELKGDLIFTAVAGEEDDSIGAKDFVKTENLDNIGAIIIGEPTLCEICIAEKGALWLKISTFGKTAHGSAPDEGLNAIIFMNAIINKLLKYKFNLKENPMLGKPTLNIGTISGGVGTNVVPDKCTLTLDIRTIPGQNHKTIVADLKKIIENLSRNIKGFKARIEVLSDRPAVETDKNNEFVQLAISTAEKLFNRRFVPRGVNYYTDASIFLPAKKIPTIICGPGDPALAHQPNEFITLDNYFDAIRLYTALALNYLL